jgi:F-type H+-transporting ATPase subunit alpha
MATRGQNIASAIKREIDKFGTSLAMYDVGVVAEIGDGIARINGLASAKYNELLQFPNDIIGIAMNLEEDSVAALSLVIMPQSKKATKCAAPAELPKCPSAQP